MEEQENTVNDSVTLRDVSSIFSLLPVGYNYTNIIYDKTSILKTIKFECNELNTEEKIKHWARKFGESSYIVWRVTKTNRHLKRIQCNYKMEYRCQFSSSSYQAKLGSSRKTKSIHCPATMSIKCSPRSNTGLEQTLTEIVLKNEHNHSIGKTASTLTFRDVGEATQDTLRKLYSNGHIPQSAYQILQADVFIKHGSRTSNDRNLVPDVQYCYNFFYKEFRNQLGNIRDVTKTINFCEINNRLARWSTRTGGYAKIVQTDNLKIIICIVTPLMLRVHQTIPQSAKVVFVDCIGKSRFKAFLLSTDSPVGYLPLGYIITTDAEKTNMALEVFMSLDQKGEFFYGRSKHGPENVFAENSFLQTYLTNFWRESQIHFTPVDMVRTIWIWLKMNIIDFRDEILIAFKNMLYAQEPCDISTYLKELKTHPEYEVRYSSFCNYLESWLPIIQYWSMAYFRHLLIPEEQKNIYVEYTLRSVRDIFIRHIKNYEVNQLIDLILTRFDKYYAYRIKYLIEGKFKLSEVQNFLPNLTNPHASSDIINKLSDEQYLICAHGESDFFLDFQLGFCSCSEIAQKGGICEHQVLVALYKIQDIPDLLITYRPEIYNLLSHICNGEKDAKHGQKNDGEDGNEDTDYFSDEDDENMEENDGQGKHAIDEHSKCVINNSETVEHTNVNMETVNAATENEDDNKEVIIIEVEPDQSNENCSNKIHNLENVLNEIVLRVEDCQNEEMLEVMKKFCENYRLFCDNDEDLKIALSNFGTVNFKD